MRGEVGEGSRQRMVVESSVEEIVHVSTISFATGLNELISTVSDQFTIWGTAVRGWVCFDAGEDLGE
jgi:hypothetical protein